MALVFTTLLFFSLVTNFILVTKKLFIHSITGYPVDIYFTRMTSQVVWRNHLTGRS